MKKGAKKAMTINDLAVIMAGGFEGLENRMTNKINGVETKLTQEIGGVKNQIEGLNNRIDDFAETKVSKNEHKKLETRVGVLEKKS